MSNRLLSSLSNDELSELELEPVSFALGAELNKVGRRPEHVYFPEDGVVALIAVARDGKSIKAASVGREGVIGAVEYPAVTRAIALTALRAKRTRAAKYKNALNRSEALRSATLDYSTRLVGQVQVNAVCNALHSVSDRVARLLGELSATTGVNTLYLTQDNAASLLGIRRTSASSAFVKLSADGLINYARGNVTILNDKKLHAAACGCLSQALALIPKGKIL